MSDHQFVGGKHQLRLRAHDVVVSVFGHLFFQVSSYFPLPSSLRIQFYFDIREESRVHVGDVEHPASTGKVGCLGTVDQVANLEDTPRPALHCRVSSVRDGCDGDGDGVDCCPVIVMRETSEADE